MATNLKRKEIYENRRKKCIEIDTKNYIDYDKMRRDILSQCDENKVFHGDINIRSQELDRLPDLSDITVDGNFDCTRNNLKDLKGSPKKVTGMFDCWRNDLESLDGCPAEVGSGSDLVFYVQNSVLFNPEEIKRAMEKRKKSLNDEKTNKTISNIDEQIYYQRVYNRLKESAKERHIDFNLHKLSILNLLRAKKCYYSGLPITRSQQYTDTLLQSSVDRIDCNKGYVSGNIVACSMLINNLKNSIEHPNSFVAFSENKKIQQKGIEKFCVDDKNVCYFTGIPISDCEGYSKRVFCFLPNSIKVVACSFLAYRHRKEIIKYNLDRKLLNKTIKKILKNENRNKNRNIQSSETFSTLDS